MTRSSRAASPADIAGVRVFVATAEDTIIAKLEWARAEESERQLRDVVGVLQMRAGELDLAYGKAGSLSSDSRTSGSG